MKSTVFLTMLMSMRYPVGLFMNAVSTRPPDSLFLDSGCLSSSDISKRKRNKKKIQYLTEKLGVRGSGRVVKYIEKGVHKTINGNIMRNILRTPSSGLGLYEPMKEMIINGNGSFKGINRCVLQQFSTLKLIG